MNEVTVIDITFVIATVAFFKNRVSLAGWKAMAAAFIAVLFVAFLPELVSLFPSSQLIVDKVVFITKLFLSAPGLYDAVVEVGGKINNSDTFNDQ